MPLTDKKRAVDVLVAAQVEDGSYRILMLRRAATDSFGGMLKPMGGKAEPDELIFFTAVRELEEEAGSAFTNLIGAHRFRFWLKLKQIENEQRQVTNVLMVFDLPIDEINALLEMEEGVTFKWLDSAAVDALVDGSGMKSGVPTGIEAAFPDTKAAAQHAFRLLNDPELRALLSE